MKAGLLVSGSGALVILTSYDSLDHPGLVEKFGSKGISKYIAYEVPLDKAKERYAGHFDVVTRDLHETDDLRILDYDGSRAFKMFSFSELGKPIMHES
jgi:hypothetical protein